MRLAVTVLAIVLGLVVAWAAFQNAGGQRAPEADAAAPASELATSPSPADAPDTEAEPASADVAADAPPSTAPAASNATAATPAAAPEGLHVVPVESPQAVSIGSTEAESPFDLRVDLVPWGAGVQRIALADYRVAVKRDEPYVIHDLLTDGQYVVYPFAARSVTINGTTVPLQTVAWEAGQVQTSEAQSSVEYRVTIADADDQPVVDVVRRYVLPAGSYDLKLEQRVINRTDQPLQVAWSQNIQGDLTPDDAAYMGDRRMFVTGYFNPGYDPRRTTIYTDDGYLTRSDVLDTGAIWPNRHVDPDMKLAWLASENRYFAVVTHAPVPPGATTADVVELEKLYPQIGAVIFPSGNVPEERKAAVFTLGSTSVSVPASGEARFPLAVYAGPRDSSILSQPPYSTLHLGQLVRYELTCAFCTFQWLAHGLLWFLTVIEGVVFDWGVAIVILVLVVRLLLHPITKRAQIGMMKMGKQMQALQPEIEKLKKKHGDDQARINQEMMKLYREKGINPANMLGCLPMLLQTPIWIALYAMLYLAIELRHEPAFYGVFQWISGGHWMFLADLSSPDNFLRFGTGIRLPLPIVNITLDGINLLPILMGVVFYFNMKFTSPPPPEGKLTEQQEMMQRQQKMMRIMMPFLMPLFLYSAPSGLTLYICASTFAGIVDSYIVRKHVKQQEEAGTLFEKKPRKPGGLMDRLSKTLAEKQQELMERQQQAAKVQQQKKRGGKRR